jgi:hypothetical protein
MALSHDGPPPKKVTKPKNEKEKAKTDKEKHAVFGLFKRCKCSPVDA